MNAGIPTGKLAPQSWMTSPETLAVVAALEAGGREARFIGGCVRDSILKMPVKDIDIATPEPPERVLSLLQDAGIKAIPTGIDHGTITAVIDDKHYEVTTLRVDVETDGRRATVAFTDDWLADALRRDFTINTLSCTVDGDIYDPLTGLEDLGAKWVRFVGNAHERIEEDVLRLLRFFRFYATYGKPQPDIDALQGCRLLAPRLKELSAERVCGELFRTLLAPNPADTMLLMNGERVLEHILLEATDFGCLRMVSWLESTAIRVDSIRPDPVRRLASMLSPDETGYPDLGHRLHLSNAQAERLSVMTRKPVVPDPDMSEPQRRRALYHLGPDHFRDLIIIQWASELSINPRHPAERTESWLGLLADTDNWEPVSFPLLGRDVLALGMEPGPAVGELIKKVEQWWEDGNFQADRQQCLDELQTVIKRGHS